MKKFYALILISFFPVLTFAQSSGGGEDLNGELRIILNNISFPTIKSPFFYDMVGHMTDERWFVSQNFTDTNSWQNWYNVYDEMRYSAHDTSIVPQAEAILAKAELLLQKDTIPISVMNFDYDKFIDSAFAIEDEYFSWNEDQIWDKVGRSIESYSLANNIFLAAPLSHTYYFRDVRFKISPDFIFHHENYRYDSSSIATEALFIDFGDGLGWKFFDHTSSTIHNVIYPNAGTYLIKVAIFQCDPYPNCVNSPLKYSQSYITVTSNTIAQNPSQVISAIPGLEIGYYQGCNPSSGKKIIYLEGLDFFDNRNIPEIYHDFFDHPSIELQSLRAYNYDLYIVNWEKSKRDLRQNAMSVVKFIESLKATVDPSNNEQFVIIGESMGGVIGRLVLNYMESEDYAQHIPITYTSTEPEHLPITLDWVNTDWMHNTRLFISLDAPHQGAYVPVSMQHLIVKMKNLDSVFPKVFTNGNYLSIRLLNRQAKKVYNEVLQSKAARQMLIYHVDGWNLPGNPNKYTTLHDKSQLEGQINAYKPNNLGMPEFVKAIGISSGLLTGERQVDYNADDLVPGFLLADVHIDYKKKILRLFEKRIFRIDFTANAIAEVNGAPVLQFGADYNYFKLQGCLRKLFKGQSCGDGYSYDSFVAKPNSAITYEVFSGGNTDLFKFYNGGKFEASDADWFIFGYSYEFNPQNGSVAVNANYGLFTPKYFQFSLTTDALTYCFIPVRSALNFYPGVLAGEINIYTMSPSAIFTHTGFDVISGGRVNSSIADKNLAHLNFSNPYLRGVSVAAHERLLQREVGDDVIFLNNFIVNRVMKLEINEEINFGFRNPTYTYNQPFAQNYPYDNFISRDCPLEIVQGNNVKLFFNTAAYIDQANCSNCNIDDSYFLVPSSLPFCPNLLTRQINIESERNVIRAVDHDSKEIGMFPNPSEGVINVKLDGAIDPHFDNVITISDVQGQRLQVNRIFSNHEIISISKLPPGFYFANIHLNGKQVSYKLIKN